MSRPHYSVLMSLYEKENPVFLKESLESVFNQTVPAREVVVVLDGPVTDAHMKILKDYGDKIKLVPLKQNVGLGLALNEGLKQCQNQLVARMDTDDIMKPKRCEKQLEAFSKDEDLVILGTQIDEFSENPEESRTSRVVPLNHDDILNFSKKRNPFNHPSVMYKKDRVLAYDGYRDIRRNQDFDLFVRMLIGGEKARNLNESLLYFRANADNLKRRKSWNKVWSDIKISNRFRKLGHASLTDFIIVSLSHLVLFFSPNFIAKWISENLLRKKSDK